MDDLRDGIQVHVKPVEKPKNEKTASQSSQ
jgi:hypothetical protein